MSWQPTSPTGRNAHEPAPSCPAAKSNRSRAKQDRSRSSSRTAGSTREAAMLKYETIAQDIQSRIEDGDLVPNDKLPTVVDLCDRYGVSKITVKRAFEILTEKGLIASKRGSGTYVKNITELFDTGGVDPLLVGKDGTREDTFGFTRSDQPIGFTASHSARGRSVSSVVYDFSVTNPPESVARHLSISPDDFTYYFCRVRCLEDDPITIEYTYMPIDVTPGLKRDQLYHSVYSFVQDTLGLKISSFHRIFRAVPATEKEAERLGTTPGSPMLEIAQVGFLDDGTPFEYSVSRYEGTRGEVRDINVI